LFAFKEKCVDRIRNNVHVDNLVGSKADLARLTCLDYVLPASGPHIREYSVGLFNAKRYYPLWVADFCIGKFGDGLCRDQHRTTLDD
jgi:hypothetical protein